MHSPFAGGLRRSALGSLLILFVVPLTRADWQRDNATIAWQNGSEPVWKFSFDPKVGKPFFHPLTVGDGPSLTNFRPDDHPWHYGLWFSWKYINHVNYWEIDRATGRAEGETRWGAPSIETRADGGATIRLELSYIHPSGRVEMTESRELRISAPAADGSYAIDWRARFTAGKEGALLDRTPMPGEPGGKVNGGYAGLAVRMASAPLVMSVVSTAGPVTRFEDDRARPAAAAVACNFTEGAKQVGGLAILSDPANAGDSPPWYVIRSPQAHFDFVCAAILAPKPIRVAPGGRLDLHYRIALRRVAWTPEALLAAMADWPATGPGINP